MGDRNNVSSLKSDNVLLTGTIPAKRLTKRDFKGNARRKDIVDPALSLLGKKESEKKESEEKESEKKDSSKFDKYSRGEGIDKENPGIKNKILQTKILNKEDDIKYSEELAGRTEVLLGEVPGCIEAEDGEVTRKLTQGQIKNAVDITSATKRFDLTLSFGPYRLDYTNNGRHLLLGGKRGHVAAFDWVTKELMCEINVMEAVVGVKWLHLETMFAVSQKDRLYVYNNQGVELHCVQDVYRPLRLEFLPYHFLLVASTESGWIKWLDVTMGKVVAGYNTYRGRLPVLVQNPYNAIVCTGHANGTVAMWSPNIRKPVTTMLCHNSIVQAISIDRSGYWMATSGCNKDLKIWDIRKLEGPVQHYKLLGGSASDLSFSQSGLLAASCANTLQIYKDCVREAASEPYLVHRTSSPMQNISFCPYEDVLGLATYTGFSSILVPGAGEANFDALEVNPLRSKSQRRETEVRSLLDKIPAEMISLDPTVLSEIDLPTLKEKWDAKQKILYARAPEIDFVARRKKRQGKSLRRDQVKKIIREEAKKTFYNKIAETKASLLNQNEDEDTGRIHKERNVLDRFKSKRKTKPQTFKK